MEVPGEQRGPRKGNKQRDKVRNGSHPMEAATRVRTVDMEKPSIEGSGGEGTQSNSHLPSLAASCANAGWGIREQVWLCMGPACVMGRGTKQAAALRRAKSPLRLGPKRLENEP